MSVKQGQIPAAGSGSRLGPFTNAIPKELLPDGDRVADMVEKPQPTAAPSNLGALGTYVFETSIFDAIARIKPGHKGEYQLTDAIRLEIAEGRDVRYRVIDGIHIDVGTPRDLMRANEWYLRENGHTGQDHTSTIGRDETFGY
ncbi:MAG: hypothetical protein KO254_06290 [Methanoculleus marisnigri]|nr:hypothetical protein [Methanoculleus marisnigri]